ncbi:MAG: stage III sporulation protein AF [Firmicutes bacterium]|nr:stage III sporulation protein AF [Bacillota bacterium]
MAGYFMGIAGAIVLTTLIDVLLAEGETKKYVKGIVALLVLGAIIAPLPALLNKDIDFTFQNPSYQVTENPQMNENYLNRIYMERYKAYELNCQNLLKAHGIEGAKVRIDIANINGKVEILTANVDLSNAHSQNGINRDFVLDTVAFALNIDRGKVVIT